MARLLLLLDIDAPGVNHEDGDAVTDVLQSRFREVLRSEATAWSLWPLPDGGVLRISESDDGEIRLRVEPEERRLVDRPDPG